jgi:hypothetical protein
MKRMSNEMSRRNVLKLAGIAVVAAAHRALAETRPAFQPPSQPAGQLPKGKIGNLEISRLILGTNHITFCMHSRGLRYVDDLARHYNTEQKIMETFAAAEANGVNAFITHSDPTIERIFREYRDRHGGKMKWIVAPWNSADGKATDVEGYIRIVPRLVDAGVDALYVPGMISGDLVMHGKGALIGELLNVIAATGLPAGISCHELDVVRFCEKEKLPVEFYIKTFHHLKYPNAPKPEDIKGPLAEVPGYWCSNPEETAELMKCVAKPWIAFKVMAAGAIPPRSGFNYAFASGADFILAGVFDFQMAEDAQIVREVVAAHKTRLRPWRG